MQIKYTQNGAEFCNKMALAAGPSTSADTNKGFMAAKNATIRSIRRSESQIARRKQRQENEAREEGAVEGDLQG